MIARNFSIFFLVAMSLIFPYTDIFGLQSGGVEIGDLETGSVVGQPFTALDVDLTITATCVGGRKSWYPPTSILNLSSEGTGGRAGRPILVKVTNNLNCPQEFTLSADSAFAGPTSMNVKIVLQPGETKYIGIPISDLTYVTTSNVIIYGNNLDNNNCRTLNGQLLVIR